MNVTVIPNVHVMVYAARNTLRQSLKTDQEWIEIFSQIKHGHILWDGTKPDPSNPYYAIKTSREFIDYANELDFVKDGSKILDFGCGNGRFCITLTNYEIEYHGVDTDKLCIEFCKNTFKDYPNFHFYFQDVVSYPNPDGSVPAMSFSLPFDDNYFDSIIVYSVFTHLRTVEITHRNFKELTRVLKPMGKMFSTWYRSPPNIVTSFYGRTVLSEHDIMNMFKDHEILRTYGGCASSYYDQWCIFSRKRMPAFML